MFEGVFDIIIEHIFGYVKRNLILFMQHKYSLIKEAHLSADSLIKSLYYAYFYTIILPIYSP